MSNKIYTGVGSRETPRPIQIEMTMFAEHMANLGWTLRSGHASGADKAFEDGAQYGALESYLPWTGFNGAGYDTRHIVPKAETWMYDTVQKFHPAPKKLGDGAYKMMLRNACQILGQDGKTPTKFVVCWTPNAASGGGTGQAIRIAKFNGIPVFDMALPEYATKDLLLANLSEQGLI